MLGWTFSFTKATGTDRIRDIGIDQVGTMDHGITSEVTKYRMSCEIYLLIFVTLCGIMNGFDMRTSIRIGRGGSARSTGTGTNTNSDTETIMDSGKETLIGVKQEVPMIIGGGKATIGTRMVGTM